MDMSFAILTIVFNQLDGIDPMNTVLGMELKILLLIFCKVIHCETLVIFEDFSVMTLSNNK
eukprot:TRINITY_DN4515_c1_g1_i1.p2 TRINITY_DN4515_c1_g1~~TRINITY_DN4515_c1_g1_i1.p2  ORF type:complete len:61 (-),score=5.45 TRINITY_DN4515_c1_g1_i1:175-357(-)